MQSEEGSTATDDAEDVGEALVDFMKRSTRLGEALLKKAGLKDWLVEQRLRHWRFAGHTARRTDDRWNKRLLEWLPAGGVRCNWRPNTRWSDPLDKFWSRHGVARGGWEFALRIGIDGWSWRVVLSTLKNKICFILES